MPVYQRPYSWGKEQIERLVNDLIAAFQAPEQPDCAPTFFIGTMLLSEAKDDSQDVIDGQQRLSTLLVILKVLADRHREVIDDAFPLLASRFKTHVTSEQIRFSAFCESRGDADAQNNAYLKASEVVAASFDQAGLDDAPSSSVEEARSFDAAAFVEFLLRRVYFVVIEASGPLARKLQIFDSINTAGMDLGSGDVFKIRYYDYLRHVRGADESVFSRINNLYALLSDSRNREDRPVIDMDEILRLYQTITISRLGLARSRFNDSPLSFFESAFDAAMKRARVEGWSAEDIGRVQRADETLSLADFDAIIQTRLAWDGDQASASVESRCALRLIRGSRYPRYWVAPILFRYSFPDNRPAVEAFTVQLAKLLVTYSFLTGRSIYRVHDMMRDLYAKLFATGKETTPEAIIDWVHQQTIAAAFYSPLAENLEGSPLTDNTTRKYLGCRISAMLHEFEAGDKQGSDLVGLIFNTEVDVEHVQPINDRDGKMREAVWSEWGQDINHIGNLVLLERSLNRSISNNDYTGMKRAAYQRSKFRIVRDLAEQHETWDLNKCKERAITERARLVSYLNSKDLLSHPASQLTTP